MEPRTYPFNTKFVSPSREPALYTSSVRLVSPNRAEAEPARNERVESGRLCFHYPRAAGRLRKVRRTTAGRIYLRGYVTEKRKTHTVP